MQDVRTETAVAGSEAISGFVEPAAWRRLLNTTDLDVFAENWLRLQCELLGDIVSGVLVLRGERRSADYAPAAVWPDRDALVPALTSVVETSLGERRGVIKAGSARGEWLMAYPILADGVAVGVVGVQARRSSDTDLPLVMRQLQWGSSWIEAYYRRRQWISRDSIGNVLDVVAVALEPQSFAASATATVTELAQLMGCERVSVGFRKRARTKVAALSHSAEFSDKNNLIRAIGAAIDEAVDQQCVLVYPEDDPDAPRVVRSHAELAAQYAAGHVCTVPLASGDEVIGGLVFERAQPFARHDVEQLEYTGALVGPILNAKRLEDRWIGSKILASAATLRDRLFGPRHPGLKLAVLTAVLILGALTLVVGTHRVTADASLEGVVQQSVTAPISGYVSASSYRAGDVVEEGAVLAALDERDFQLERLSLFNEREKHRREYSRALAEGDRAMVRVLDAQIEQADAEIRLLDEQLARTRITAPFTGLVVDGDLSQSLSAPVERGQVLFRIAPLDSYRVILMVDERDIAVLAEGQSGRLALAGAPGEPLVIRLSKITPVSKVVEGQNRFRVEAELDGSTDALRPGMEGVAKVDVGQRSLLWIYTHKFTHWLRQWWWRVQP